MIGLLFGLAVNSAVVSDAITAGQLNRACTEHSASGRQLCQAFLLSGATTLSGPRSPVRRICPPATASYEDFHDTFTTYLAEHAEQHATPALVVMVEAYEGAYPCRGVGP